MKKFTLYVCIASLSIGAAHAQFIKQSSILANGSISFSAMKNKDSDDKTNSMALNPWAGYSVIDNLVAGIFVNYSRTKLTQSGYKYTDTNALLGPMIRYYHDKGIFAHAQAGFGSSKSKTEPDGGGSTTTKYDLFGWGIGAGYAVRIADVALFEPLVMYQSMKTSYSGNHTNDSGVVLMGSFTIFLKR